MGNKQFDGCKTTHQLRLVGGMELSKLPEHVNMKEGFLSWQIVIKTC